MSILYKNALLVDFETGDSSKVDILVEENKIVEIASKIKADAEVVDLDGNIVMPAFCNCYFKSGEAFYNSYLNAQNSYCNGLQSADGEFTQNIYFGGRTLTVEEKNCVRDFLTYKNLLAGAVYFFDFSNVENLSNVDIISLWKNKLNAVTNRQLSMFASAGALETDDEEKENFSYIEDIAQLEEKQLDNFCVDLKENVIVKVGQNLEEMGKINSKTKSMPSEYIESFGILDNHAIIVGSNCFEKDEISLFSGYDTDFVLLPNDDARSGRRFANLNLLKELNLGIGSGSFAEIDFFAFMRQILSYNSFVMESSNLMDERKVLRMATIDGAKIMGIDSKVKVGNSANFLVLNYKNIFSNDIFKGIIYELSKEDIVYSVVNGKIICKNGVFVMENQAKYDKIKECIRSILRSN